LNHFSLLRRQLSGKNVKIKKIGKNVNIIGLRSQIPNFKFAVIHNTFAKELPAEEARITLE
jgi:hypothetical protein